MVSARHWTIKDSGKLQTVDGLQITENSQGTGIISAHHWIIIDSGQWTITDTRQEAIIDNGQWPMDNYRQCMDSGRV